MNYEDDRLERLLRENAEERARVDELQARIENMLEAWKKDAAAAESLRKLLEAEVRAHAETTQAFASTLRVIKAAINLRNNRITRDEFDTIVTEYEEEL